jgi:uncharacterized membrane protein YtjA (UPF0391 family)
MLRWAVVFLIIALIAGLFGFTDLSAASAGVAKILFTVFMLIFLGALALGLVAASKI